MGFKDTGNEGIKGGEVGVIGGAPEGGGEN